MMTNKAMILLKNIQSFFKTKYLNHLKICIDNIEIAVIHIQI
jgi:hypothetical protein